MWQRIAAADVLWSDRVRTSQGAAVVVGKSQGYAHTGLLLALPPGCVVRGARCPEGASEWFTYSHHEVLEVWRNGGVKQHQPRWSHARFDSARGT